MRCSRAGEQLVDAIGSQFGLPRGQSERSHLADRYSGVIPRAYPPERLTSCGQVFSWAHGLLAPLGDASYRACGGMDGATVGKQMLRPPGHGHLMGPPAPHDGQRHVTPGQPGPVWPCRGDVPRRVVGARLVLLALTVIGCGRYPCSSVHAYPHARGTRSAGLVTRQWMRDSLALDDHPGAGPRIRSHMKAYDCAHFQPQGR